MKSKITFLIIALSSAVLLSACTSQNNTEASQSTVQNQNQNENRGPNPSGTPGNGQRMEIDYAAAAEKLNITEKVLKEALGITEITLDVDTTDKPSGTPKRMDLSVAAKKLNITVEVLQEALGINVNDGPQGNGQVPPQDEAPQSN